MKKVTSLLTVTNFACLLVGCAGAPTAVERKFYDIETNLVGRVMVAGNVVPVHASNAVPGDLARSGMAGVATDSRR